MDDATIIALTRLVLHRLQLEPADDIGRAKTRDELRTRGVPVAAVDLDPQSHKTVIRLDDGRSLRVWSTPDFEIVVESDDVSVVRR